MTTAEIEEEIGKLESKLIALKKKRTAIREDMLELAGKRTELIAARNVALKLERDQAKGASHAEHGV